MANFQYEKMSNNEPTSSVLVDGPDYIPQVPVRIRHYFVFSLFSAVCLCPATGLIALAYSLKSSAKADVKFHEKAQLYSRRSLLWNLISVVIAIVSLLMVLAFCYYVNEASKGYNNYDAFRDPRLRSNGFNNEIDKFLEAQTN